MALDRRRPTMADVAERAGVSLKTVSRVVNGEPRVAGATTAAVLTAVRELGFRSNHAAASLARGRRVASVGLVIGAMDDPFYARLAGGVEQVARAERHALLISSSEDDPALEREITLGLVGRQVDGLIVVPSAADQSYLVPDIAAGLSVVFVDRPPHGLDADCVLSDNAAGARAGTAHLLAGGHRRIAFVGNDPIVYTSAERLRGFRAAHGSAGVAVNDDLVVLGPRTSAEAEQAVTRLLALPEPPTAVFAQNNLTTMGCWRALHAAARAVALVGFDDFALADVLQPPVDVVVQDPDELGRQAATLLFDRLAGGAEPPRRITLATTLLTRS
jgi:LacI family transcriptional regulator